MKELFLKYSALIYLFLGCGKIGAQQVNISDTTAEMKAYIEKARYINLTPAELNGYIQLKIAQLKNNSIPNNGQTEIAGKTANTNSLSPSNIDFETGNFNGWSHSNGINTNSIEELGGFLYPGPGNATVVSGGTDIYSGYNLTSPLGGNFVAKINSDILNAQQNKIATKIFVTPNNNLLKYAYATILQKAGHECAGQPYFAVQLRDTLGNLLYKYLVMAKDSLVPGACQGYNQTNFISGPLVYYSPWKTRCVDLSAYNGQNVFLEVVGASCTYSGHFGYGYFDARLETCPDHGNPDILSFGTQTVSLNRNIFYLKNPGCLSPLTLNAPSWPAYREWNGPAGSNIYSATTQSIQTSFNGLHTLAIGNSSVCPLTKSIYIYNSISSVSVSPFPATVCVNGSYSVIASGALSYTWSNGAQTPSITISQSVSGNYSISVTASYSNGCTSTQTYTYFVAPLPTVAITGSSLMCNSTATLQGSGASSYYWYNSGPGGPFSSNSPTINSYLFSNTISLTGTSAAGCTASITYTLSNQTPLPPISITNSTNTICTGSQFGMTIWGPLLTYSLTNGISSFTANSQSNIWVTPTVTSIYTITGSNVCGAVTKTVAVNVQTLIPNVSFTTVSPFCPNSTTLQLSGADTYTFNSGVITSSTSQQSISVNTTPTTTLFTLTGKFNNSVCLSSVNGTLTPLPNAITLTPQSPVCSGSLATFSITGGNPVYSVTLLQMNQFPMGSSFTVTNPFSTTITPGMQYLKVQSYDLNGCLLDKNFPFNASNSINLGAITVPSIVCIGQSATIEAGGAPSYTWVNGPATGTFVFTPTATTVFTVNASNDCTTAIATTTLNYSPTVVNPVTITATPTAPCKNTTFTLTANGASSYTWGAIFANQSTIQASINGPTAYSVTYINAVGCTSVTPAFTVTPQSVSVSILGPDTICASVPKTFTASGANTYSWILSTWFGTYNGTGSTYSFAINDFFDDINTFTLTGANASGCTAQATRTIVSLKKDSLLINSPISICPNKAALLKIINLSPAMNTFSWSNGPVTPSNVVTPSVNTIYTIQAIYNAFGCTTQTVASVNLYSYTPVSFSIPAAASGCASEIPINITSIPLNATVYPQYNGNIFYPSAGGTYTLNCYFIDGNNCVSQAGTQTINVNGTPIVNITGAPSNTCQNTPTVMLNGVPAGGTFSGNNVFGQIYNPILTGSGSVIYSYTDANGCSDFDETCININPAPNVNVTSNYTLICAGQAATLIASGANSYTWNTNITGSNYVVVPSVTTTYTVIGSNAYGCQGSAIITQNVSPCTSLSEVQSNQFDFLIFPNPTVGELTIVVSDADKLKEISVYDALGSLVLNKKLSENITKIEISNEPKGFYFIKVGSVIKKIVLQ